jgi:hypothetical protein
MEHISGGSCMYSCIKILARDLLERIMNNDDVFFAFYVVLSLTSGHCQQVEVVDGPHDLGKQGKVIRMVPEKLQLIVQGVREVCGSS